MWLSLPLLDSPPRKPTTSYQILEDNDTIATDV